MADAIGDSQIGRLAVDKKFLTLEELHDCIAEQKSLRKEGKEVSLTEVMLRCGFLTRTQLQRLGPELEDTIARGDRKSVILDNPIAVHLVYFTAWLDADGTVQFREDIYGQDARLLLAIKQSTPDVLVQAENALPGLFAANANPERFPPEATGPAGRSSVAQPGSLGAARPTGI